MDDHPVFQVPADRPGQYRPFDMTPEPAQVRPGAPVVDPDDVLLDDRPGIKFRGDVMGGRADQLDTMVSGLPVRVGADERRQEAVMNVDDWPGEFGQEARRKDSHVASEDDQVDPFGEQPELSVFRAGFSRVTGT